MQSQVEAVRSQTRQLCWAEGYPNSLKELFPGREGEEGPLGRGVSKSKSLEVVLARNRGCVSTCVWWGEVEG